MSNRLPNTQNEFLNSDFLLQSDFAKRLYHDHVKNLPIIDYHNHLSPNIVSNNKNFNTISEVWLAGDHYKWRAMRALGIDERYITGDATDWEKFEQWARTVPYTVRNPLYHWTHLELQRYFGIEELLSEKNARKIYEETNRQLQQNSHNPVGLLKSQNVELICTTDDPVDSLEAHHAFANEKTPFKMTMAFRPDKAYSVENPIRFNNYLVELGQVASIGIASYSELLSALQNRINFFHSQGCRLSDHGLDRIPYNKPIEGNVNELFDKIRAGKSLEEVEVNIFRYETLLFLCKAYHAKGWVQQFHLGALRNTNSRMLEQLGPDAGFDSIGDFSQARSLANFLNQLDTNNQLTKTIIYNINPSDNEVIASMIGNFNDGSTKGKIQFGSGWWYLDQKDGMEKQLNTLSNIGMLSCFVGMLTDSRSFLSFPRHEYFRRVLCNLIGNDVKNGELPADEDWLGKIASDICYHNAKNYFDF